MKHLLLTIAAVVLVGCGRSPIHVAARDGNIEAVKQHLAAGTDVNVKSGRNATTPLHLAANNSHKEIVELLIVKGADVNAKDGGGDTPLDEAIFSNHSEIAALLRKHGGKTRRELKAAGN